MPLFNTSYYGGGGGFLQQGGGGSAVGDDGGGNSNVLAGLKEALAAYGAQARKEADFDMDMKRKDLDLRVAALRQQGRLAEAEIALKKGELALAKERLAWEKEIQTKQFNLERAGVQAQFMSGPDMLFLGRDLMRGLASAELGVGPAPYASGDAPQMRTPGDFEAAEQGKWDGSNGGAVVGGNPAYPTLVQTQPGGTVSPTPGNGGIVNPAVTDAGTGPTQGVVQVPGALPNVTGTNESGIPVQEPAKTSSGGGTRTNWSGGTTQEEKDLRANAAQAVLKAIPPSTYDGLDESDSAALNAIVNIYRAKRPGTLERMRPGQRQAFVAGLTRAGYWAPDAIEEMQRAGIGQGNVRQAV